MIPRVSNFPESVENVPSGLLDDKRRRDNVHDFIDLNEIERAIIDTPEFQRLRQIRQLGFGYLLYQSAEHSRFAHSLGVCHTAKLLVDWINRNHTVKITQRGRKLIPDTPLFGQSEPPRIRWIQRAAIGLAALMHDLPHPPMSHALEQEASVLVRHDKLEKNPQLYIYLFKESSAVFKALSKYSKTILNYLTQTERALGLRFSEADAKEFLTANALTEEQFLSGLIFEILAYQGPERHPGGTFFYRRSWKQEGLQRFRFSKFFRPFYADLISNTICADLVDYLLRDAMNTGVRRAVDMKFLDRLFIKPVLNRESETHVVFDLHDPRQGIRKDTVSALLSLLESRYDLMERVYMHRTKLAASAMLGRAYSLARVLPDQLYDTESKEGCPSDDALLRALRYGEPIASRTLAKKILDRRIYRPLFIIDDETCKKKMVTLDRAELIRLFRAAPNDPKLDNIIAIEKRLARTLAPLNAKITQSHPFIIFCMDERVAYKDPKVIVEVPADTQSDSEKMRTTITAATDVLGVLRLLRDHATDQGLQSQIASLTTNYSNLWKLYVFADWELLTSDPTIAERIPRVYSELVYAIGREYPVSGAWTELSNRGINLRDADLHEAVENATPLKAFDSGGLQNDVAEYLHVSPDAAQTLLHGAGIQQSQFPSIEKRFRNEFPRLQIDLVSQETEKLSSVLRTELTELAAQVRST